MYFQKYIYTGLIIFVAVCAVFGLYFGYQMYLLKTSPAEQGAYTTSGSLNRLSTTTEEISNAYSILYNDISFTSGSPSLLQALKDFHDLAADETQSNLTRSQALNGINYAYTKTNFDADDVYAAVFSEPPFSEYYTAPAADAVDPLHPESGGRVEAVEKALVKLNQLSNALYPNHYAIVRMEVAEIFSYQREVARNPSQEKEAREAHATRIKDLIAAYDALPPLSSYSSYSLLMRIQILFGHAGANAFVGKAFSDTAYLDRGEQLFKEDIEIGEAYPTDRIDSAAVLNETSLARIFYASHYWGRYKTSDPQRVISVLRPMVLNEKVKETTVYKQYLPTHKNSSVTPFSVLREIAQTMPELKTFLQGAGWKF